MRNEDKNNNSLITNRNILLTYNSNLNKSNPLATNNNSRIELRENGAWDGATSEDLEQLAKMLENFQPQPQGTDERTFENCRVRNENVETQPTSSTASRVLSDFRTMAAGANTDDAEDKAGDNDNDAADHGDTNENDDDGENRWLLGDEEEEAEVLRKRGRRTLPRPISLCLSSDLGRQPLARRIIVRSKMRSSLLFS
jgi:hypothetical protein